MASKYVLISLVSLLVFLLGPVPSKVSAQSTSYTSIAIEGKAYCKCKFMGYDRSIKATPQKDSVVEVSCKDANCQVTKQSNCTDANGYFYINWPDVQSFDPSKCTAYLTPRLDRPYCSNVDYPREGSGVPLYLEAEKSVEGGIQGVYSPVKDGIIWCGPPANLQCPPPPFDNF